MRKTINYLLPLALAASCMAQSKNTDVEQKTSSDNGLVRLAQPYAISTAPHFAVLLQFPRGDSIRRIALGDSNYFLAEADKDDPHYAIVKQIRGTGAKSKSRIETNMLVYMASGRVVNIKLKGGKLADTAYSVDYPLPNMQPVTIVQQVMPQAPPLPPLPPEKVRLETERTELTDKMLEEVEETPKKDDGIVAGGLILRFYRTERLGELALVSFDVENATKSVVDLEDPQINLNTAVEKGKNRKKATVTKSEPVELVQSQVSAKQLRPGERAVCLITFKPPVHDSDQQVLLAVSNRAMANQPATYRIE